MQISATNNWIHSPRFDLSFVIGGAFFTLFVAGLAFAQPALLPIFFWIWIIGFEGSHFWATFSRTYIDNKFRAENKTVLIGSLVFFIFPALAIYADSLQESVSLTSLYGFFIFTWSLYHNARQHYGFLSIYCGKAQISQEFKTRLIKALYFSIVTAQIYFLMNFKIQGAFGVPAISEWNSNLSFVFGLLPIIFSFLTLGLFLKTAIQAYQSFGSKSIPAISYVSVCWVFYSVMFYYIAPQDQFVKNLNGGETLMLIAIMNSLFHNIQYHAIVWYYGQKRFNSQSDENFGVAKWVNYKSINYAIVALLMGLVFAYIVWNVGDWPTYRGEWNHVTFHPWAYILFFGIIGHHFYLDQKIWRPSHQLELRSYLLK